MPTSLQSAGAGQEELAEPSHALEAPRTPTNDTFGRPYRKVGKAPRKWYDPPEKGRCQGGAMWTTCPEHTPSKSSGNHVKASDSCLGAHASICKVLVHVSEGEGVLTDVARVRRLQSAMPPFIGSIADFLLTSQKEQILYRAKMTPPRLSLS